VLPSSAEPNHSRTAWNHSLVPRGLRGVPATDDEDFSTYVAARWASLVRVGVYLGCTPVEAEDLVQTTLLRCYRAWSRVRRADRVDAYVHRALVSTLASSRRRRWHGELPTADLPDAPELDATLASDARADLGRALARLSLDHRTVLVLRFLGDLTEQQTADVLGIPLGTVKSRVARALAAIDHRDLAEEAP
jgi:RNA polymerase sigma-70 factor (sigma-E family)